MGTKILICVLIVSLLMSSGCIGSFGLTNKFYKWNTVDVSESKWLSWLLFLGMVIIPVYQILLLGDAIIFNTIEFYGGNSPFSEKSKVIEDGDRRIEMARTADGVNVKVYDRDRLVEETNLVARDDGTFVKMDLQGNVLSTIEKGADGTLVVTDAADGTPREYRSDQVASLLR